MAANSRTIDFRVSISIPNNRKVKRLRRDLGPEACWSLVVLWAYCAGNEPDGQLIGWSSDDLESAAEWDGERGAFAEHAVRIGLVDSIQTGGFAIHDWADNQPWIMKAEARSILARKAATMRWACGAHAEGNALVDAERMPDAMPPSDAPFPSIPSLPPKLSTSHKRVDGGRRHANASDSSFLDFWAAYPRKQAKQDAIKAFASLNPDKDLVETMLQAIRRHVQSEQWQRGIIPLPASWIRGKRWEDEGIKVAPCAAPSQRPLLGPVKPLPTIDPEDAPTISLMDAINQARGATA